MKRLRGCVDCKVGTLLFEQVLNALTVPFIERVVAVSGYSPLQVFNLLDGRAVRAKELFPRAVVNADNRLSLVLNIRALAEPIRPPAPVISTFIECELRRAHRTTVVYYESEVYHRCGIECSRHT